MIPEEDAMQEEPLEESNDQGKSELSSESATQDHLEPQSEELEIEESAEDSQEETGIEEKSRKWLIPVIFVAVFAVIAIMFFAFRGRETGGYKIGLSLSTLNNPFFVTLRDSAQLAADAAGVELIVVDAQDDPAKEATNIEDLIQRGVDALLINPTDADAVVPSIQKANQAGIPVFTIDRTASGGGVIAHIASDNVAGGRIAAEYLCRSLGGSGKVVELEGIPGTSAARDRGQGFNEHMSSQCSGVEIIVRQTANFNRAEGLTVFENILQAQPQIDGVFAHNDEMVLGAIEAAEAAGRANEIVFVGFDAIEDAVQAVSEVRLAATIAQQPAEMGKLGVETALLFLDGNLVEIFIPVDLALVTSKIPGLEETEAAREGLTFGLSLSTLNNPFFVSLKEGAEATARIAGIELIVVDAQDDPAKEATNIEDLIQRGVDALLINPTDVDAVVPSIQKANQAGIPVFTIDRSANGGRVVSHIASDNVAGGRIAAEYLCRSLGGSGKVVELEGIPGTSAARDRGQGFNDYMRGECPGVEIVARQTANFNRAEGLSVFENILQARAQIDGVFAHNDEMVLGAIEAAEAEGRANEIVFVGFDAIEDAIVALEDGQLTATIAQQARLMGNLGVESAVNHLRGEIVEDYIPVELVLVESQFAPPQPTRGPEATAEPQPTETLPSEGYTIGFSISTLNNPFFVTLKNGAEATARLTGVELIVLDAQNDPAREATNIDNLIQREVDALLINPSDADMIVPSILKANQAGIPVITLDRTSDGGKVISHIASDNVVGGSLAAEYLCEILEGTGNMVELEGTLGSSAARDRSKGFNDYLASQCPGLRIIARQTANFSRAEGLTVFEDILEAESDIDGVFAHNDDMALGAIQAAEAADREDDIVFFGFDGIDDALEAIDDEKMAGTIAQQPALMGSLGVEFAVAFLNGQVIESYIPVELTLITADTFR